jgi:hypothetical protein
LLRHANVPAAVVRAVTSATTLDPRRTRSVTTTRPRGFTTTFATTWPSTRRTETLAAGGAGFGRTTGGGVGAGIAVGTDGAGEGADGGGGGGGGAVTVSTWLTGSRPAVVAETVGVPGSPSV